MPCVIEKSIVEQLCDIYYHKEYWQKDILSPDLAVKYHQRALGKGNIQVYEENGEVLGYYEVWRINFEQFGRLVCHTEDFYANDEDTTNGNIAYVANVWIKPEHRKGKVFRELKLRFFKQTYNCEYFVGEAIRKKCGLVKVFKKSELSGKLFKEGEL